MAQIEQKTERFTFTVEPSIKKKLAVLAKSKKIDMSQIVYMAVIGELEKANLLNTNIAPTVGSESILKEILTEIKKITKG